MNWRARGLSERDSQGHQQGLVNASLLDHWLAWQPRQTGMHEPGYFPSLSLAPSPSLSGPAISLEWVLVFAIWTEALYRDQFNTVPATGLVGKEASGAFQGKFIDPREEVEKVGNSLFGVLYDSFEGWYLSSKESSLEKRSWERNQYRVRTWRKPSPEEGTCILPQSLVWFPGQSVQ